MRAALPCVLLPALVSACATLAGQRAAELPQEPAASRDDQSRALELTLRLDPSFEDDYVVRVVADDVTCSGTLIDDNQVLTAHHCVAERDQYGDALSREVEPERIRVELGGDYMPWGEVGVSAVVAPPCGYGAGDGDIAILVLERHLVGVETLAPRLERAPKVGEAVEPLGFGRCVLSSDGIRRQARKGGSIESVKSGGFRLAASICPGDSGGPAVGEDGQLVGVISTSVMDGSEKTVGRSEFTRLDRWRPVFAMAKLVSEGASPAELPPLACPEP